MAAQVARSRSESNVSRCARTLRLTLVAGRPWRLSVFDLGLACCAVEFVAATIALDAAVEPDAELIDVLVVSGTVTIAMGGGIRAVYDGLPAASRRVLAFGACATTGGPYWDSYSVVQGVDALIPVDVYVPGCPPRPQALLDGLRRLDALIGTPA